MGSFLSPQMKRLLGYVKPYRLSMGAGVVLLAVSGVAETLIALMIKPIVDRVLNPGAPDSNVLLFTIPHGGPSLYLNRFFPPSIHNVWAVVSISLLVVFFANSVTAYGRSTNIKLLGTRSITDFRNAHVLKRLFGCLLDSFSSSPPDESCHTAGHQ